MSSKLGLKLGWLVSVAGLALPLLAADRSVSLSGHVRSSLGVPQMGAMVEVLGSEAHAKLFTDEKGFYSAKGLRPGFYTVKVSAPSFLPALRERLGLRAGGSVVLNVTLNTLFEAIQFAPLRGPADDDDWKWVLRSTANRPILRVLEDGSTAVTSESAKDSHDLKGSLSFVAGSGSEGFGSASDVSTGFAVEKSMFSAGTVAVRGNVGYANGSPTGVVRASYKHKLANGAEPQVALTMRRLPAPEINARNAALQALALRASNDFTVGDVLELRVGSELESIQFLGRATAFRPFGSAALHFSPDTMVEYRYATTEPDRRLDKGFDSAPADLSESGPHVSLARFSPGLERAHHHEISLSHREGKTNMQVAVYADRVIDPALTGIGEASANSGEVLPDLYSGTFTYRGKGIDTRGMRLVLQRQLMSDLTATLDYGYGGVLDLGKADTNLQSARDSMVTRDRHSLTGKFSGTLPKTKTRWIASYRWINGQALTPVDMFNASAGQSEGFLSVFVRQPLPGTGFLPGHMEAILELRNLLAQGYVPVMGQDGHTVYLVDSARAVRGGVAFTF